MGLSSTSIKSYSEVTHRYTDAVLDFLKEAGEGKPRKGSSRRNGKSLRKGVSVSAFFGRRYVVAAVTAFFVCRCCLHGLW